MISRLIWIVGDDNFSNDDKWTTNGDIDFFFAVNFCFFFLDDWLVSNNDADRLTVIALIVLGNDSSSGLFECDDYSRNR